jgi:hypothetical protein
MVATTPTTTNATPRTAFIKGLIKYPFNAGEPVAALVEPVPRQDSDLST